MRIATLTVVSACVVSFAWLSAARADGLVRRGVPREERVSERSLQREGLLEEMLAGPMKGVEEIVFAIRHFGDDGHWYANFGYWSLDANRKMYRPFGRLCKMHLPTGRVTVLLDDPEGTVRDPQVHYDGKKVLFSYRPGGKEYFHLYEIGVDGEGLRRLTDGPFDDIEPTYLPDGRIAFASSRCKRWVQCWYTQVATLYTCAADGSDIRPISANVEHDNTPWPMADGRLMFTRWEYVDRSQVRFHHLWTCNPDGTGQMALFGNMHPEGLMIDAKPIAGTRKIAAVYAPRHGRPGHMGHIVVIDPDAGPDHYDFMVGVSRGRGYWRDPYPFGESCFLACYDDALAVMDAEGNYEVIFRDDHPGPRGWRGICVHEPRPIRPRKREPVIPSRVDWTETTGTLVLSDVMHGRRMTGVEPGEIEKLLVLESLPKPVNFSGGMDAVSPGGSFTIPRILGTVPVEPDGSACFEVPALRPVFFVALDANDLSVKRMQSFVSVMPGETTGCAGCHENRTDVVRLRSDLQALRREPSRIEPIEGVPDVLDYMRDIQPIVDKHCVRCHNGGPKAKSKVNLTRGRYHRYANWPFGYIQLFRRVAEGGNANANRAPRTIGTSASKLIQMLRSGHHDVKLSPHEYRLFRLWVEAGAVYPGTYAALGSGGHGVSGISDIIQRRCSACHAGFNRKGQLWNHFRVDVLEQWNLDDPPASTMLRAPLAKSAGGLGLCIGDYPAPRKHRPKGRRGKLPEVPQRQPPFADANDPDYRAMLQAVRRASPWRKRSDMEGFIPNDHYIREMKRYGVLRADWKVGDPIDVYALDQAYWRSLWYVPDGARTPGGTATSR
jgi:hypothetical protein